MSMLSLFQLMHSTITLDQLHSTHPFRILNYNRSNYKNYNIYNLDELQDFVTNPMIKNYRELFYNYDTDVTYCNLCNHRIDTPIQHHLNIKCPRLKTLRYNFWSNA